MRDILGTSDHLKSLGQAAGIERWVVIAVGAGWGCAEALAHDRPAKRLHGLARLRQVVQHPFASPEPLRQLGYFKWWPVTKALERVEPHWTVSTRRARSGAPRKKPARCALASHS